VRPFTFTHGITIPYTVKGIKLIEKVAGMSIPGAQVLMWAQTIVEIYNEYQSAKTAIQEIKSAFDLGQAIRHCRSGHKRSLMDNITDIDDIAPPEAMELPETVVAKVKATLAPPKDWQAKHDGGLDKDPPGLCPIYAKPKELRGKFCLCHNGKGTKIYPNCSVFDILPAEKRENIKWSHSKCLPVNCKPIKKNHTTVTLTVGAGLDSISHESTESFVTQLGEGVGSDQVDLVAVAQGNETADTTELTVQLPAATAQALSSVTSLKAPDGKVYPVSTTGASGLSAKLKWTYIIIGSVALLALAIIALLIVLVVKGVLREKEDAGYESEYVRYVKA